MSTELVKSRGIAAGFSRVLGTANSQFVLLSRETDGSIGRRIFINSDLAPKFVALVAKEQEDTIMAQLKQLRAIAGLGNAYSNRADAFEHMHLFGNLKVGYKILQLGGGRERAGVYITDVDFADFAEGNRPGVYRVEYTRRKWKLSGGRPEGLTTIDTTNAAVNGPCESRRRAATDIMPDMVLTAYGDRKGKGAIHDEGYSLFYNPQGLVSGGKEWRTPEQKLVNSGHAAALLGNALLEAQQRKHKVQWTVHGNGAKLFGDALRRLGEENLDCHEVIFLAPSDDANLPGILGQMRRANMRLHEEVMRFQTDDWSSSQNRVFRTLQIKNEVEQFGESYKTAAATIQGRGLGGLGIAGGLLAKAGLLNPMILLSYKSIRNMTLQRRSVMDPNVNPHFHPFKDAAQFNAHADAHSANRVFFSEILKKIRGK